ncbi:MAG TPA: nucleotidyltransferase domain-containing protein [Woeseiaceae bacterium]|jgi:predicted nucleotidyltransferase|nr:nucleotidyltransferase domain-containing protein [Woeseiaceae bacterium]
MSAPTKPIDLMFSAYRRKVLEVLLLRSDEDFHVRELERLTGVPAGSLHRELKALSGAGLLTREHRGNQVRYRADRSSPIYSELAAIFRKTSGLVDVLRDSLQGLSHRIDVAFVFGSMASGEQRAGSDVDILVIGTVSLLDVVKALGQAQERLGREMNPIVMRRKKFLEAKESGERFVQRLLREPKRFVIADAARFKKLVEDRPARRA